MDNRRRSGRNGLIEDGSGGTGNGDFIEGGGTRDRPKVTKERGNEELFLLLDRAGVQTNHIVNQILFLGRIIKRPSDVGLLGSFAKLNTVHRFLLLSHLLPYLTSSPERARESVLLPLLAPLGVEALIGSNTTVGGAGSTGHNVEG